MFLLGLTAGKSFVLVSIAINFKSADLDNDFEFRLKQD